MVSEPLPVRLGGATVLADPSGALFWPGHGLLAVADLHLEKGSSFARRGVLVPPYDTRATLDRLDEVLARLSPRRVLCLGDSLHDSQAVARMDADDAARVRRLTAAFDWVWISGNHDPQAPAGLGGLPATGLTLDGLMFRHAAADLPAGVDGEVSGHLHPVATVRVPGRQVRGRCFVGDGTRLVLPAFGAYAGGLDVGEPAVAGLFPAGCDVLLLVRGHVHRFARRP
jgi:DNA ligase-associated metallophosphoesterase